MRGNCKYIYISTSYPILLRTIYLDLLLIKYHPLSLYLLGNYSQKFCIIATILRSLARGSRLLWAIQLTLVDIANT